MLNSCNLSVFVGLYRIFFILCCIYLPHLSIRCCNVYYLVNIWFLALKEYLNGEFEKSLNRNIIVNRGKLLKLHSWNSCSVTRQIRYSDRLHISFYGFYQNSAIVGLFTCRTKMHCVKVKIHNYKFLFL
jgi:hypothetical protein